MTTATTFERVFADYEVGEVTHAGSHLVTADDISGFAEMTGDRHPAHVDEDFATGRFGGRLAHGVLTFGLVVGLTVEYNTLAVAYGYDGIRFPRPVFAGDTVTGTAEVIEVREHKNPAIGLVVKQYTGVNQNGDIVLVAKHTLAVQRAGTR